MRVGACVVIQALYDLIQSVNASHANATEQLFAACNHDRAQALALFEKTAAEAFQWIEERNDDADLAVDVLCQIQWLILPGGFKARVLSRKQPLNTNHFVFLLLALPPHQSNT